MTAPTPPAADTPPAPTPPTPAPAPARPSVEVKRYKLPPMWWLGAACAVVGVALMVRAVSKVRRP